MATGTNGIATWYDVYTKLHTAYNGYDIPDDSMINDIPTSKKCPTYLELTDTVSSVYASGTYDNNQLVKYSSVLPSWVMYVMISGASTALWDISAGGYNILIGNIPSGPPIYAVISDLNTWYDNVKSHLSIPGGQQLTVKYDSGGGGYLRYYRKNAASPNTVTVLNATYIMNNPTSYYNYTSPIDIGDVPGFVTFNTANGFANFYQTNTANLNLGRVLNIEPIPFLPGDVV